LGAQNISREEHIDHRARSSRPENHKIHGKAITAKSGAPKLEGKEAVGGKEALLVGVTSCNKIIMPAKRHHHARVPRQRISLGVAYDASL
jgi:hypothetical protein